jgi:hypothetical protein
MANADLQALPVFFFSLAAEVDCTSVDANDGAYHHRPFGLVLHEVFKCTNVVCLQYYSK